MQTVEIQALSDRDLLVQMFEADRLLGDVDNELTDFDAAAHNSNELSDEVDRRFGKGACDNISSWSVVSKAGHEDLVQMAKDETEHMVDLARGHDCTNDSLRVDKSRLPEQGRCWCGRIWTKMADRNSWFDSTEGDPSLLAGEPSQTEAAPELAEALRKVTREQQEWADRQFYGHA